MPAEHCGRRHDIYVSSCSHTHGVAPKGKWVVVASARVEGSTKGLNALAIAKRELGAVLPLLRPSRKLLAEVVPYYEPQENGPERLFVLRELPMARTTIPVVCLSTARVKPQVLIASLVSAPLPCLPHRIMRRDFLL